LDGRLESVRQGVIGGAGQEKLYGVGEPDEVLLQRRGESVEPVAAGYVIFHRL
jgi:hypothetical protein